MNLTCEQADELLGEYAISALAAEDQAAVEEHLVGCPNHGAALAAYRAVAGALALTTEEVRPPRRLRGQLLSAFDREARTAAGAGLGSTAPLRQAPVKGDWWRRPSYAYGIAAALLIALVGLSVWNLSLRASRDRSVLVREATTANNRLRVIYFPGQKLAVVDYDLPQLTPDHIYQAWQIPRGGAAPISLGLLGSRSPVAFKADLSNAGAVAVSIEPPGGSAQPTTTPIVVVDKLS
jgi:anti-sigma-K factor RskA